MAFLFRRALNKFAPVSLEAAAVSQRIVHPEEMGSFRPALCLAGELDAVMEVSSGDRDLEWKRVNGTPYPQLATREYRLKKARLKGAHLASGRFVRHYESLESLRPAPDKQKAVLDRALLSTNVLSGMYFGHWARDSLVTEIYGLDNNLPSVAVAREPWPHEPDFRRLSDLSCLYASDCRIDELTLLDDRGHNAHWVGRFRELRRRMREGAVSLPGESAGPLVFLGRGAEAPEREPTNLSAAQAVLEKAGFRTVVAGSMSTSEIARSLRDARIVVSAEGSHLNHVHFFAPNGMAMLIMQDPRRFNAYHNGLTGFYDGWFAFVVGKPDESEPGRYRIDLDQLQRTLDLAAAAQRGGAQC